MPKANSYSFPGQFQRDSWVRVRQYRFERQGSCRLCRRDRFEQDRIQNESARFRKRFVFVKEVVVWRSIACRTLCKNKDLKER